jgi:hypothetical protein
MTTLEQTILDRSSFMNDLPALQPALAAITRAVDVHTKMKTKAAEVAKDTHRTAIGKRDVMQKFVGENAHEVVRIPADQSGQHPSSSWRPLRCWQPLSSKRLPTTFQAACGPYSLIASRR